ncbi:hypothetical protein G9A89_020063 [Geosiphon pyriformis]|nr:hypothetical protein G9A89_020063 [Geosiphon pyriformis]
MTALVSLEKKAHIYKKRCNQRKTNSVLYNQKTQWNYAEDASSIIESTKCYHFSYPPSLPITFGASYLEIPAGIAYTESDFCNYINAKIDCLLGHATDTGRLGEQIHQSLLGYSTATTTRAIAETLHIIDTDIKYYMAQQFPQVQQPVESNFEEYENESNNPVTVQAKSMVNKKSRVLSPTTSSYHQTPQSRIVFNPPPETHWTKSLGEYGLLFGNLNSAAGQTEGNPSTWKQSPAQNLAESASPLTEETAILQPIGSSNKGKQPALAPREHSNTWTPIPLNIITIKRDYYTMVQVLNQFIKGLWNSILRSVRLRHLTSLQDAITLAHNFESAEQEANHTQVINLAINRTSDIDAKITQLSEKLTQKIEGFLARTTGTYQPPQWRENNNNSRYSQQQQQPWRSDPHNYYYCQKPRHIARDCRRKIIDQNQGNPYQQPRYQQNMGFDKSTPVKGGNIERISQPSKQTKSNIPPATITKDTTLATIFPFDIDNLNTHSLFSGAAINQDKPIMALYTDIRVGEIDIKLILDSGLAGSIITKQLMDQLDCQIDCAATARIITVDGNTKTPIGKIDNFPFEINRIQIPTKHARVPAMCRHFKNQRTEEPLIEFEDTSMPPTIETYQVSWVDDYQTELLPPPTWEEKEKGRTKEEPQSSLLRYITSDQRNLFYQPPRLICVDCGKKLSTMGTYLDDQNDKANGTTRHASHVAKFCQMKDSGMMCLAEEEHATRLELAPTHEEQKQKLANLNTKLCDYCLIPCHFQYCDECDLMFNPPPKILFPITKLPESEEEVLITKDMSFQDPTEDTKTEQYFAYSDLSKELELKWYSDNEERICPKRVHDTNAGFDLPYPGQSPIIIVSHSLVKIDLKIALEISVSTMVQVAF